MFDNGRLEGTRAIGHEGALRWHCWHAGDRKEKAVEEGLKSTIERWTGDTLVTLHTFFCRNKP